MFLKKPVRNMLIETTDYKHILKKPLRSMPLKKPVTSMFLKKPVTSMFWKKPVTSMLIEKTGYEHVLRKKRLRACS